MAEVTLKGITKVFPGNVVAVNDISLEIKDKETAALSAIEIARSDSRFFAVVSPSRS